MNKLFTLADIKAVSPCYDPIKYLPADWSGTLHDILSVEECPAKDRMWVAFQLLDDKTNRLFALWCAREALSKQLNPDERSLAACDVAERFANGQATTEELESAESAARSAASTAASVASTARSAASATSVARSVAARSVAARSVAESVAESVASAAWSAESVVWAARSAAESAAESAESAARSAASATSVARSARSATSTTEIDQLNKLKEMVRDV